MDGFFIVGLPVVLIAIAFVVVVAAFALWIMALVHCIRNPNLSDNERLIWVLILIFIHVLGAILYWLIGSGGGIGTDRSRS